MCSGIIYCLTYISSGCFAAVCIKQNSAYYTYMSLKNAHIKKDGENPSFFVFIFLVLIKQFYPQTGCYKGRRKSRCAASVPRAFRSQLHRRRA